MPLSVPSSVSGRVRFESSQDSQDGCISRSCCHKHGRLRTICLVVWHPKGSTPCTATERESGAKVRPSESSSYVPGADSSKLWCFDQIVTARARCTTPTPGSWRSSLWASNVRWLRESPSSKRRAALIRCRAPVCTHTQRGSQSSVEITVMRT